MDHTEDGEWVRYSEYLRVTDGWLIQHNSDSRELRRLCEERDSLKEYCTALHGEASHFRRKYEDLVDDLVERDAQADAR